jgi:hypothetical protein
MTKTQAKQLVVCVENDGYAVSLEKRKIYVALRDAAAEKHNMLRIVDESGEDYLYAPENLRDTLALNEDEEFQIVSEGAVNVELFARAIAKIAYCHAIIHMGLHGFRPLLIPKIILGESGATPYFVGSPVINPPPPFSRNVLHFIQQRDLASKNGPLKLHIMEIRLFAASAHKDHGMPIYYVIVGAPKLN